MYLIDTNIISELRKGDKCDRNVAAWYASVDESELYLSVLVLGEIRKGIERTRSNNPTQAQALESWLSEVEQAFANRILTVDSKVADEWGRMTAKRSVSTIDALLAATAKIARMTLVTRNVSDVADLDADIFNPFAPLG
jgi:predicted nucleic acid-binding protein